MRESTGHIPTSELVPMPERTLQCPECGTGPICAQNKAFVTQNITLGEVGIIYETWGSEDVEFDGPEWYVCRNCGVSAESIHYFVFTPPTDDEIRKLARTLYDDDSHEFDSNAKVSRGTAPKEGAFVSAWVWVRFPEDES